MDGCKPQGKFHKKITRTFLSSDMLRLYFLRVQGNYVATWYTFKYNNKLFYYQGGWDPEWPKDRVGNILTNLVIEDAINKWYSEYDFLRGMEPYKARLTGKRRGGYLYIKLLQCKNVSFSEEPLS